MAKRRANGEGCIHKRKDGRWMAKVTIGWDPETQKTKQQYFYGKTQEEVKEKLREVINSKQNGTYTEPTKITFGEWLETWLKEYAKPSVRPTTYDFYEYLIRVHIKPEFEKIQLKNLQPEHLQKFYNKKRQEKKKNRDGILSAKTVRYMQIVVNLALKKAVECWKIPRNPNDSIEIIKTKQAKVNYLTPGQIAKFLHDICYDEWYPAFLTELGTGMRLGELAALKWRNVDLDNGIIHVKEAVSRVNTYGEEGTAKTTLIIQPPKSEKGIRSIPIPDDIIQELKKLKTQQKTLKRWTTKVYSEMNPEDQEEAINNSFVFIWPDGRMVDPNFLSKHFLKLAREKGISEVHFHSLRHSYASLLLANGEEMKIIQENLGHSNLQTTSEIYTHVLDELKVKAASKLNGFSKMKRAK